MKNLKNVIIKNFTEDPIGSSVDLIILIIITIIIVKLFN